MTSINAKWPVVKLAEVCSIVTGGIDPQRASSSTFAHYSLPAFDSGAGPQIEVGAGIKSQKTLIENGVVLVSKLNPRIPRVWLVEDKQQHQRICSTEFVPLRCNSNRMDSLFLAYALRHSLTTGEITGSTSAATKSRERAKPTDFLRLTVPLPSLYEQRRLVDILSRADGIVRLRREAQNKAAELIPALFLDMFGDPVTNPKGWPVKNLGEFSRIIGGSSLPTGEPFEGQTGGLLLVKVSDMNLPGNEVEIVFSKEWIPDTGRSCSKVQENTIVFPKRGAAIATNKKRIMTRPALLDPNLMGIASDERIALTSYLYQWFCMFDF
jgi:type I restriction enzyme S subunit